MLKWFRQGFVLCSPDIALAQYALESSSQPLGISEYELEKLYPEKIEGTMPSIKEIEAKLEDRTNSWTPLSLFAHIRAYAIRPYSLRRKTKCNDTVKEWISRQMNGKYVGRKGVNPWWNSIQLFLWLKPSHYICTRKTWNICRHG